MGNKDFLSVKGVAELLALSEMSVYKLIKTTDIPFKRVFNKYRIRHDHLDEWWDGLKGKDNKKKLSRKTEVFKFVPVDRVFVRNIPHIVGQHRFSEKNQINFLDKITLREGWIILYLYSLSDPNNILGYVEVKLREIYEGLKYTWYQGRGKDEIRTDQIQELKDSLFGLRTFPIKFTCYHEDKNQDGEYRTMYITVLDYLNFKYSEEDFECKEVVNFGTTDTPILAPKHARPRRIYFRLNAKLMQGLIGKGIGFWKMPKDLFNLRDKMFLYEFQFILWVLSQGEEYKDNSYKVKINREEMIKQLGFRSKDRKQNERTLLRAYEKSVELGILDRYELDVPNKDGRGVSDVFYRSDRFYFKEEPKLLEK